MDKFIAIVNTVIAFLTQMNATVYVVLLFLVETWMRLAKSEKPRSLLLAIAACARAVGGLFLKLDEVLSKIIPQKLN